MRNDLTAEDYKKALGTIGLVEVDEHGGYIVRVRTMYGKHIAYLGKMGLRIVRVRVCEKDARHVEIIFTHVSNLLTYVDYMMFGNSGAEWTEEEDAQLVKMYDDNIGVRTLRSRLCRDEIEIMQRVKELRDRGRIKGRNLSTEKERLHDDANEFPVEEGVVCGYCKSSNVERGTHCRVCGAEKLDGEWRV
jgi:hypothetical protein